MEALRTKSQQSSSFLTRLIKRSNRLHTMLSRGNGHSEYKGIASSLGLRPWKRLHLQPLVSLVLPLSSGIKYTRAIRHLWKVLCSVGKMMTMSVSKQNTKYDYHGDALYVCTITNSVKCYKTCLSACIVLSICYNVPI